MTGFKFHALANIFPLIEGRAFEELTADIAANGLRDKIVMLDGMVLDGRNRSRAAIAAGFMPADVAWRHSDLFVDFNDVYPDTDPLKWVLSKNLHRRHLTESQRAMVAHRLEGLGHGGNRRAKADDAPAEQDANLHLDRATASETMNVSPRSTAHAAKVATGAPELGEAVDAGRLSVSAAAEIANLPKDEQRRIVESVDPSVIASMVKEQRATRTEAKKQARADRESRMGRAQLQLEGKKFGAIYLDPEWKYETYSENGMDRSADNHYPTSSLQAIMSRDVKSIAAPDCVLFMWATVPMLMEAICVLDAWGFASLLRNPSTGFLEINRAEGKYVSHAVWLKEAANGELVNGTGYWLINEHEVLIIARRGNVPAPAMGTQARSVLRTKRGVHSAKPDEAAEMIEAYYPTMPKIELNRRGTPRPGWWAWGNEVEGDEALGITLDANGFADASHLPLLMATSSSGGEISDANTGGDDAQLSEQPDAPAASGALSAYQAALAAINLHGQHNKETARPLLELGRAAGRTPKQLAEDLGHPTGTIKTWIARAGLNEPGRLRRTPAELAALEGAVE